MSLASLLPFAPRGAHRVVDREYLIVVCESDASAIRAVLPHPLVADGSNSVQLRFIATRDPAGAGSYMETSLIIPAVFDGVAVDFTAQRYADEDLAVLAGSVERTRAWPRQPGRTRMLFTRETASAVLEVAGRAAVLAEMGHGKHGAMNGATGACSPRLARRLLADTHVNLKREPATGEQAAVAQLIGVGVQQVRVKSAWSGTARLHRSGAELAPIAHFPLKRVIGGFNFVADVTLARAEVLFDYRHEARRPVSSVLAQLARGLAPRVQEVA